MNPSRDLERKLKNGIYVLLGAMAACASADIAGFDTLPLSGGDFYNGADLAGGFSDAGIHFNNDFNPGFGNWAGFAYSRVNDTTTPGFGSQYATWTPGTGAGGSGQYGVVFADPNGFSLPPVLTLSDPARVAGLFVNNATYSALSMRDGDAFAKQFGGVDGNDPDFFKLTISGKDAGAVATGAVEFYLADFRFADPVDDYIVDHWTWVDLRGLGPGVKTLHFDLDSSDVGAFGVNTPAYFTIDQVTVIPEPATGLLALLGILLLARYRSCAS
jgi:hypothetical protein